MLGTKSKRHPNIIKLVYMQYSIHAFIQNFGDIKGDHNFFTKWLSFTL